LHGDRAGAVPSEPRTHRLLVEPPIGEIEAAQRHCRAHHAQPVGDAERPVAGQRQRQVRGSRQAHPAQPGAGFAGGLHGDVHPRLERHLGSRPDAVEELEVLGAATHEHVLPVVVRQAVTHERAGRPAEPR
jgi:hypothetical protein